MSTHDSLFRRLFADVAIARDAVRAALPPEVVAQLDLESLALRPTAHVDAALHAFHADLVFDAKLAGRDALVILLVEHQSVPDERMPFRLLQYAVMIWDAHLRDHPASRRLPLIVPIVFHQGPRAWRAPRDLVQMFDLTPEEARALGRYVPRMGFELEDLATTSDEALLASGASAVATLALSALREVRTASDVPALVVRWGTLLREGRASPSGARAIVTVLRYILQVHPKLDVDELARSVERILEGAGEEIMTTAREYIEMGEAKGRAEGEAKGRAEGEAKGRAEGRRATLRRQLRLKYREAATAELLARLDACDDATLTVLEERILIATTIAELFD